MEEVLKDLTQLTPEEQELLRRKLQQLRKRKAGPASAAAGIPVVPRQGQAFPLSFSQQRLWFLDRLRPEAAANNIPLTVELRGELQFAAFARGLAALGRRHEILRAVVTEEGGRPRQTFDAPVPALPLIDASGLAPETSREEILALARAQALEPFDLATGPLLRTALVRLAADRHVFLFTIHHLIFDRWSVGLFLGELGAEYRARLAGGGPPTATGEPVLAPLAVQYGDFAVWEQERLTGELLEERLAYWRQTLEGYDPRLALPFDRPRPAVAASRGGTHTFSVAPATAEALRRLSVEHGASLFMTLLAAFHGTLARIASSTDVGVGLSVSHRGQSSLERLIGCFTNHLVVRARLAGDPTLGQVLETVKEAALGALAHQDLPAEKVVETLRAQGGGGAGLFEVLFRLNNQPLRDLSLPGLDLEFLQVLPDKAPFDLDLSMEERDGGLEGLLVYSTDLFDEATAVAVTELYRTALVALAEDPERPLSSLAVPPRLAREAAVEVAAAESEAAPLKLAVAATFSADLLREPLELWLGAAGYEVDVELALYNQVFQQLLDPGSELSSNREGVNLVLVRLADWLHYRGEDAKRPGREELREQVEELLAALGGAARRSPAPWLVAVCPSPDPPDEPGFWRALETHLERGLAAIDGVFVISAAQVAELYPVATVHDPYTDELGNVPFTTEYFVALGTLLARRVVALRRPPFKVVVVDCDNTLWDGACAELGAAGVGLSLARRRLQDFLVAQHDAGLLVALASKNVDADVLEVFETRTDMPLRLEHVVARKVSWEPKSRSLEQLAVELGFGLDRFVFLDDNPVECAEVAARCPAVTVLAVPAGEGAAAAEEMSDLLRHAWPFDRLRVTDEDRARTSFYQANQRRNELRREAPSLVDFLAGLELVVEQRPLAPEDVPRVAQVTQRVTQFNATTRLLSEPEVAAYLDQPDAGCRVAWVRDRFGDYGLVGCSFHRRRGTTLVVENLLMSCRTLGRGVEHRLVAALGVLALEYGLAAVEIPFRRSQRNAPMERFLEAVAGELEAGQGDERVYRLPAERAAALELRPEEASPEDSQGAPVSPAANGSGKAAAAGPPPSFYSWALRMRRVADVAQEVRRRRGLETGRSTEREATPYVAPRNAIESQVAAIWCDVLGIERIGVHEHFFRIGGHSLLGTVILSRIQLDFDVDLPLMAIFDNPTVAGIATVIEELLLGDVDAAELEDLEGLSPEEVRALLEEEQAVLRGGGS